MNGSTDEPDQAGRDTRQATAGHELLNEATEWLQYASGLTDLLAELANEPGIVDQRRMMLLLGAIGSLTKLGSQCVREAHEGAIWERSKAAPVIEEALTCDS